MKTGEIIGAIADQKGLNLHQLATLAGIPYNTLYAIVKRNSARVESDTLQKIAAVLEVSIGVLMGYEDERVIIPGRLKIIVTDDPARENYSYRIEATDEEAFAYGVKILESAGTPLSEATPAGRIMAALDKLNDKGQSVAVERVEELTKIPDYQRSETPDAPTAAANGPSEESTRLK